jgi:hypothetical protein
VAPGVGDRLDFLVVLVPVGGVGAVQDKVAADEHELRLLLRDRADEGLAAHGIAVVMVGGVGHPHVAVGYELERQRAGFS